MKLMPNDKLHLSPAEMKTWPYWSYGWWGTDGCDWRQYYTNKGWRDIPEGAEEVRPMRREDMPASYQ